jgi:hypothetical protein
MANQPRMKFIDGIGVAVSEVEKCDNAGVRASFANSRSNRVSRAVKLLRSGGWYDVYGPRYRDRSSELRSGHSLPEVGGLVLVAGAADLSPRAARRH